MVRALPDLSEPAWSSRLAGLLERASLALGRLDARVSATSARRSWQQRASWSGYSAARRAQGAEIDEIDIFAIACGIFLPARRPLPFATEEAAALAAWQGEIARTDPPHWRDLVPVTIDVPDNWRERPALLRTLELVARYARADETAAPWLAMPALLKATGCARNILPCLVAPDKALRLAPRDDAAIVPRFLKAIAHSADEGLKRLDAVEGDRLRAAAVVARSLRPGRLAGLAALQLRQPALTPLSVSRTLRLSLSGAGKLLSRAAAAGLAVEISGRTAWRVYLPPDLAVAFGFSTRPIGRPPALPAPESVLPALARFDEEMAAIDARLAELGIAVATPQDDEDS